MLAADSRFLTEVISLHCLRWHEHVLRVPAHRLTFHALFHVLDKAGKIDVAVRL